MQGLDPGCLSKPKRESKGRRCGQANGGLRAAFFAIRFGALVAVSMWTWNPGAAASFEECLTELQSHHNAAIVHQNTLAKPPLEHAGYEIVSLRSLAERYSLGPIELSSLNDLHLLPHRGDKIRTRGFLSVRDAEEIYPNAAPRTYRLYNLIPADRATLMVAVALDISLLPEPIRHFVADTCGSAVRCEATVFGRLDEIEAEREINLFRPSESATVMLGLIAESIEFHEVPR